MQEYQLCRLFDLGLFMWGNIYIAALVAFRLRDGLGASI